MWVRSTVLLFTLALTLPSQSAELLKIRTGAYKDKTRVVLDLSSDFKVEHAKGEGEVTFVLKGITNFYTRAPRVTQASAVNVSKKGNDLSLNFKLKGEASYKYFSLKKPDRLVIDFYSNQGSVQASKPSAPAKPKAEPVFVKKLDQKPVKKPAPSKTTEAQKPTKSQVKAEVATPAKPQPKVSAPKVVVKPKPKSEPANKTVKPAAAPAEMVKSKAKAVAKRITKADARKALVARMNELAKGVVDKRILPADARQRLVDYKVVLTSAAAGKSVDTNLLDEALSAVRF